MEKDLRWHNYFMDVAVRTSEMSYAERLKVGAVAVRDRRILATGFNGSAPGRDNCCELEADGVLVTKEEVIHAERNLICWAARTGTPLLNTELYVTHSPCITCATLILATGFNKVFFKHQYRSDDGIRFLSDSGVIIQQL